MDKDVLRLGGAVCALLTVAHPRELLAVPPTRARVKATAPRLTPIPQVAHVAPPAILSWDADPADCGGKPVVPVTAPVPDATVVAQPPVAIGKPPAAARRVVLGFDIAADGRTQSIAPILPTGDAAYPLATLPIAALAATGFPHGTPAAGCRIAYRVHETSLPDAPLPLVVAALGQADAGPFADMMKRRVSSDGTCPTQGPQALTITVPQLAAIDGLTYDDIFAIVFDVDAAGGVRNIRDVVQPRSQAVKGELARALAGTKFAPVAYTGCTLVGIVPRRKPLSAPDRDARLLARPNGSTCIPGVQARLTIDNVPFPHDLQRRAVEGWAIVSFDVQADGSTENVFAVAAQPAATFGLAARALVEASRLRAPMGVPMRGCVVPISYRLDDNRDEGVHLGND